MWLEPEMKIHAQEIGRARCSTAPVAMRELRGRVGPVLYGPHTGACGTGRLDLLL